TCDPDREGTGAIRSGLKELLRDPNFSLNFVNSSVDVARSGDLAYTGNLHGDLNVTVYRKETDGTWKAVADINNADGPVTPAT
ncbi:MAG: hypothetical protein ABUS51_05420, partial [Acidobacteriota bacterium]